MVNAHETDYEHYKEYSFHCGILFSRFLQIEQTDLDHFVAMWENVFFCDRIPGLVIPMGRRVGGPLGIPYRQSGWLAVESGSARLGISDVLGSDVRPPPRAWPIVVHLPEWCLHRGAHSGHTASRQPAELELTRRERIPPENMQMVNYEHWNSSYAHETRNHAHCNSTRRNDGCAGWRLILRVTNSRWRVFGGDRWRGGWRSRLSGGG